MCYIYVLYVLYMYCVCCMCTCCVSVCLCMYMYVCVTVYVYLCTCNGSYGSIFIFLQPYGGGMFGRGLEDTMRVEARLGGAYIPILVHRCVKFIIEHGKCDKFFS